MKDSFDRLMEAAARVSQKPVAAEPPLGLETRVIASWRETLAKNAGEDWWPLGRPFMAFASLVMALSVIFNFRALLNLPHCVEQAAEYSLADSAIRIALK